MLPEKIIYIGVAVNLLFTFWYIKSIFRGGTRPNMVSWIIWSLAPFVAVFLGYKAGGGISLLGAFMSGFTPLLVFIFCLFKKDCFWKIGLLDIFCGVLSIFALVFYILTNNLWISVLFAIASDLLAFLPTFIKTWKYPETENSFVYLGGIFNNIIALLIIKDWSFTVYSFSFYIVIASTLEIFFIYRKRIFKKAI
ncbi:MAG: hypothetical protein WC264_01080 [Candidatus Paceibacterota bacterium]|jgi:hypothetical protein